MRTMIICLLLLTLSLPVAYAGPVGAIENSLSIHEWTHLGAGYFAADQLKRHTRLTTLERIATVAFLGYAKERWIDSEFNGREAAATALGACVYEVNF